MQIGYVKWKKPDGKPQILLKNKSLIPLQTKDILNFSMKTLYVKMTRG